MTIIFFTIIESVRSFATESIFSIPSTEDGVAAEQSSSTVSDMTAQLNKLMKVCYILYIFFFQIIKHVYYIICRIRRLAIVSSGREENSLPLLPCGN